MPRTATGRTGAHPSTAIGSTTGQLYRQTQPQPKKTKQLLIVISIGAAVVIAFASFLFIKKANEEKNLTHLESFSEDPQPEGTTDDVDLLAKFLTKSSDRTLKIKARSGLIKLQGSGVDAAILKHLNSATSLTDRKYLAEILSKRGYTPAIEPLISLAASSSKEDDKVAFLNYAKPLAGPEHINLFLEGLKTETSRKIRTVYEDTILSVLRRVSSRESLVRQVRARVRRASGGERKSLFKILGALGDPDTGRMLTQIFSENDTSLQGDAIVAYFNWPNREPLPKLLEIAKTDEPALRNVAQGAFVELSGRPGPQPVSKEIADWKTAFELFNRNVSAMQKMFPKILESPHPETLEMLSEWKADQRYGRLASAVSDTMSKMLKDLTVVSPGDELKGDMARVEGASAGISRFLQTLTGWTSPDTYFMWNFKVKEGWRLLDLGPAVRPERVTQRFRYFSRRKNLQRQIFPDRESRGRRQIHHSETDRVRQSQSRRGLQADSHRRADGPAAHDGYPFGDSHEIAVRSGPGNSTSLWNCGAETDSLASEP